MHKIKCKDIIDEMFCLNNIKDIERERKKLYEKMIKIEKIKEKNDSK